MITHNNINTKDMLEMRSKNSVLSPVFYYPVENAEKKTWLWNDIFLSKDLTDKMG